MNARSSTAIAWCLWSLLLVLFPARPAAAAEPDAPVVSITIAWDPPLDAEVVGYRVYVGTSPGVPVETHDLSAHQTVFIYTTAQAGQRYFFSVASIGEGRVVGPPSDEVSAMAGDAGVPGDSAPPLPGGEVPAPEEPMDRPPVVCVAGGARSCYTVVGVAGGLGRISSLAAASDGRLFVVEDGRRVLTVAAAGSPPEVALDPGRRITGIAIDPAFAETGLVFVGEAAEGRDGADVLSVVRYRSVHGALGEGATVLTGFGLPRDAAAPLALDAWRRLYVALPDPGTLERTHDPYAGRVLRVAADGGVPSDNPLGSPVIAGGFARPDAMTWVGPRAQLWLAGRDVGRPPESRVLPASTLDEEMWGSLASLAVLPDVDGRGARVFAVSRSGDLYVAGLTARGPTGWSTIPLVPSGEAVAAASSQHDVYVALRTSPASYSIVKLIPRH